MEAEFEVLIDNEKCGGCGICAADCPRRALEIRNSRAAVINSHCLQCGHCLAVCPRGAIKLKGYDDEIVDAPKRSAFLNEADLLTHLRFRRSIRRFKDIQIERDKIEKIIEAGRLSPTASNAQNVRYIVLQKEIEAAEDEVLAMYRTSELSEGFAARMQIPAEVFLERVKRGFLFFNAPAAILVVSSSEINGSLAAMSMELMAEALGLGALFVGLFTTPANKNPDLRKLFGIARGENIAACLALGYPDVKYLRSAPRKKAKVEWS